MVHAHTAPMLSPSAEYHHWDVRKAALSLVISCCWASLRCICLTQIDLHLLKLSGQLINCIAAHLPWPVVIGTRVEGALLVIIPLGLLSSPVGPGWSGSALHCAPLFCCGRQGGIRKGRSSVSPSKGAACCLVQPSHKVHSVQHHSRCREGLGYSSAPIPELAPVQ